MLPLADIPRTKHGPVDPDSNTTGFVHLGSRQKLDTPWLLPLWNIRLDAHLDILLDIHLDIRLDIRVDIRLDIWLDISLDIYLDIRLDIRTITDVLVELTVWHPQLTVLGYS